MKHRKRCFIHILYVEVWTWIFNFFALYSLTLEWIPVRDNSNVGLTSDYDVHTYNTCFSNLRDRLIVIWTHTKKISRLGNIETENVGKPAEELCSSVHLSGVYSEYEDLLTDRKKVLYIFWLFHDCRYFSINLLSSCCFADNDYDDWLIKLITKLWTDYSSDYLMFIDSLIYLMVKFKKFICSCYS